MLERRISALERTTDAGPKCDPNQNLAQLLSLSAFKDSSDFRPAPKPVSAAGIGDWFRKISRTARSANEKTYAFARPADAGRNIRKRSQSGVRNTDDYDTFQCLQVIDGRQDGVLQRLGFAVEVDILYPVAGADRRVVATGFEQPVYQGWF